MALLGCDEKNGAVAMLKVIPVHKRAHLLMGRQEVLECLARIVGTVFERLEERLGIRVVITDGRAAERRRHAQCLHSGQHGRAFRRAAIVGMQHHLLGADISPQANVAHDLAGQVAAFWVLSHWRSSSLLVYAERFD